MWYEVIAGCGCRIEGEVDTYIDGCCDYCATEVSEVTSANIVEACASHS